MAKKNVAKKNVAKTPVKKPGRKPRDPETPKRAVISYKDVVMAFTLQGMGQIKKLHNTGNLAKATVVRALKEFDAHQIIPGELAVWANEVYGNMNGGGRGRSTPMNGESRVYKAQKLGRAPAFIRVPVATLGAGRGDRVNVSFVEGAITLVRVP